MSPFPIDRSLMTLRSTGDGGEFFSDIIPELYRYLEEKGEYPLKEMVDHLVIPRNKYLYLPGASPSYIYEIVDGAVKLGSYAQDQRETIYEVLGSGDFFGNLRYINQEFFEFSKTMVGCRVRRYKLAFFRRVIIEDPRIAEWFQSRVVHRWWRAETKLFHIRGADMEGKVLMVFQLLNRKVTDARGNEHHLFWLLSQKEIGDLIGASRQTVSGVIKSLIHKGEIHH
ncbi:MAG TPA: Crp/Fnr family transcriptional regulator [Cytophagales bacterium]|nr:Crp/Fnr family transcriptional regulator [Cytophagales bacterium]HAA22876.1 Crp/Fnr family transcriptional regulator [Cytophagales bacterium]HAP60541.1 Crp/Fnr family transcriptional regulator [Cytophagales bacterium]